MAKPPKFSLPKVKPGSTAKKTEKAGQDARKGATNTTSRPQKNRYDNSKPKTGRPRPSYKAKASSKPQIKEGIETRNVAVSILHDVLKQKKPLDDVLAYHAAKEPMASMQARDRGFVRALAATSLRNLGAIEFLLARFISKGFPRKSGTLKEILISGTAQLLFLDTPPHAAISSAVDQARFHKRTNAYTNMTNAVLRRVQREGKELLEKQDLAQLNTPKWLQKRWQKSYGDEIAMQIMQAHGHEAGLDLSVKQDHAQWAEKLQATVLPTNSLRLANSGLISELEGYQEGTWWVQDISASLPAKLLGDLQGKHIADFCAAPGGKTAQLIAYGADVTALDSSAKRLKRLEENLERLDMKATIVCDDACKWHTNRLFDAIIIDAPCSATGTIRRHPDLPWLKEEQDMRDLVALQRGILRNALNQLKPGGTLLYGTCSLEPEEGEGQIKQFLEDFPTLQILPFKDEELDGQSAWITKEGFLRTLPHYLPHSDSLPETIPQGMDGFFAARLKKQ